MFSRKLFSSSRSRRVSDSTASTEPPPPPLVWSERSKSLGDELAQNLVYHGGDTRSPNRSPSPASLSVPIRGGSMREPSPDRSSDPLGLSILFEPAEERVADIIFIHGLGGSSYKTWCKDRRPETFWPQEWLPQDEELRRARIFTFGYNARFRSSIQSSAMGITDFSKNLLYDMMFAKDDFGQSLHIGDFPILFVTHSMGGIVFKKAFLDAQFDARYSAMAKSFNAVVFLSTPHRGTDLAGYLNKVLAINFSTSSKQYVAELSEHGSYLRNINEQFRHVATNLQLFSFYETLQMNVGMSSMLILDAEASKLGYPGEVSRSLNADHQNICKFDSPRDPNFRAIIGALKSIVSSYLALDDENDEEVMKQLERFFSISSSIDHDLEHFSSRRAEGTCEWVTQEPIFEEWLSSTSRSEVLWVHGRPARGKSVIASFLARRLESQKTAVQYFFCRAGDESKRSVAAVIRSLAYQVALAVPQYRKALVSLLDGGYKIKDSEWRSVWKHLFVNSLFQTELCPPLYWIVDGLDEMSTSQHFLDILSDIARSKVPIKVLITSRWTPTLSIAFDRIRPKVANSVFCIDNDLTDMRLYAEEELRYSHWDEELTQEVLEKIINGANDNFLWVHLVLQELRECHTEDGIRERLAELPPEMDDLYKRMEETISSIRRPSDRKLSRHLLIWAIHSRRSLALDELADVLEPEFGRLLDLPQTLSRLCGHFLTVEGDQKIGLIHQTAREYLTSTNTLPFSLNAGEVHVELFKDSISSFLDKGLRSKLQRNPVSLYSYRATSWAYHLSKIDPADVSDEQLDLLTHFFKQSSFLSWIYILASIDSLKVLVESSRALLTFVRDKRRLDSARDPTFRRFEDLERLEGWSRDLLKLLGRFGSYLLEDPHAIYTCVAPFCPTSSAIYRTFGAASPAALKVKGIHEDWGDCLARVSVSGDAMAGLVCCSGRYLAVANSHGTVSLWSCITFRAESTLTHGEYVSALCFGVRGARLATFGTTTTKIWCPQTRKLELTITNPLDMQALCLKFVDNDNTLIVGSDRSKMLKVSVEEDSAHQWAVLDEGLLSDSKSADGTYQNSPSALSISPDGSKIAAAYRRSPLAVWSVNPTVRLNRVNRLQRVGQTTPPVPFAIKLSWHPESDELMGIFQDGYHFRINFVDGSYHEVPPTPGQMPSDIQCSPDGLVYAICGANGSIKLYDYQTSTLIYQLNSGETINAFCFSSDGRRFYDIRGSHCNVWEPNALVRLAAVDDDTSYSISPDDSVQRSNVASESFADNAAPIERMSTSPDGTATATGDEDGAVELHVHDIDESVRVDQTATRMSIEHLAWAKGGKQFCYSELNSRLTIVEPSFARPLEKPRRVERFRAKPGAGGIRQLLFLSNPPSILVVSRTSVQLWELGPARLVSKLDTKSGGATRRWVIHPLQEDYLISFSTTDIEVYRREGLEKISTYGWVDNQIGLTKERNGRANNPPTDAQQIQEEVEQILSTHCHGHVVVEISRRLSYRKLHPKFIIFKTPSIDPSTATQPLVSQVDIPQNIFNTIEVLLGILPDGKMVFLNRSFWACSWNLHDTSTANSVKRHFFIPRDWLPLHDLGLLQMTPTGTILCPRNGGVSAIQSSIGSGW